MTATSARPRFVQEKSVFLNNSVIFKIMKKIPIILYYRIGRYVNVFTIYFVGAIFTLIIAHEIS